MEEWSSYEADDIYNTWIYEMDKDNKNCALLWIDFVGSIPPNELIPKEQRAQILDYWTRKYNK